MHAFLRPAQQALRDLFPDADQVDATMGMVDWDKAKALMVEGDLTLSHKGLLQTDQLLPDVLAGLADGESLVAIVVTGDLIAPDTVLMEPDYDWSPRFKVGGTLHVKSLCLGGSISLVMGDLIAEDTVFGFYNHGWLKVLGRTRARVILASDYQFEFAQDVDCRYVLASCGRLNIPATFEDDGLALVLHPEVIDDRNSPKDAEIIRRLQRGKSILRPKGQIGKARAPTLTPLARQRLAALTARAAAGETITRVDLAGCELRHVPDEIRAFPQLQSLRLSKNAVGILPEWIGELAELRTLEAEDCSLTAIPESLAHHAGLNRLLLESNAITALPDGPYPALAHLRIGRGYNDDDHVNFIANLDLARFPVLRHAELAYGGLPELDYSARADLWNCPSLEFLEIGTILAGALPPKLANAKRLKGFATSLTPRGLSSALRLCAQWPDLEVLSLGYGDLRASDVAALADALPGVYLRIHSCDDLRLDLEHPLYRLNSRIGTLVFHERRYAEAARQAETLLAELDFTRPRFEVGFFEDALRHCIDAFMSDAAGAEGAEKVAKILRTAALADRILALLPKTPALSWLLHQRDLGLLRVSCLLAQALRHSRGPTPDKGAALAVLDAAQAEADDHMDQSNAWFMERAGRIGALRTRILAES